MYRQEDEKGTDRYPEVQYLCLDCGTVFFVSLAQ